MAARPTDDPSFVDSTAALASLYQAPFAEFIARRSALVSQLKRSGHKDVAARIAAAPKPSRAAYLVNQVYWRAQPTYDALLDTGTAARAAQQARLLGDAASDVGETLRARDLAFRVRHSGAGLVIADRAGEAEIEEMLEQLERPVAVLYLDEARAELARYVSRAPTESKTRAIRRADWATAWSLIGARNRSRKSIGSASPEQQGSLWCVSSAHDKHT